MRDEKIVGYVLLALGLGIVCFSAWLAFSIFSGAAKVPQLIYSSMGVSDPFSSLVNVFLLFSLLAIIMLAGSIISSRGVTLIKEVKLRVVRDLVGEQVEVLKKEKAEGESQG